MLPGPAAQPAGLPGVIAPDGSAATVVRVIGGHLTLHLINLASGADQQITVLPGPGIIGRSDAGLVTRQPVAVPHQRFVVLGQLHKRGAFYCSPGA